MPTDIRRIPAGAEPDMDPELRAYLRDWRRTTARQQGISAFIVMYDTSLDELCRKQPSTLDQLRDVTGFGQRKVELYGQQILDAFQRFREGARAAAVVEKKSHPAEQTLRLLAEGRSFEEISKIRGRQISTIVSMVATLVETGEVEFQPAWVDKDRQAIIEAACARLSLDWLKPLKDALPPEITYSEIKLVVASLRRKRDQQKVAQGA